MEYTQYSITCFCMLVCHCGGHHIWLNIVSACHSAQMWGNPKKAKSKLYATANIPYIFHRGNKYDRSKSDKEWLNGNIGAGKPYNERVAIFGTGVLCEYD